MVPLLKGEGDCEMKHITRKIIKSCGTPVNFCFDFINGASVASDIRRMKEYVRCVKHVERLDRRKKVIG